MGLCEKINLNPEDIPVVMPDYFFLVTVDEKVRMDRAMKRKNAQPADIIAKVKGNQVWRMEEELKKFNPIVIDNSGELSYALNKITKNLDLK